MARQVAIVPHTHWDREWYSAFQTFRMRLVSVVDDLLDRMEADPSYTRFLLDGQMAVVDDYLEVRPEAEERLRRLATSGRLSVGPWYILMDEFLVSGETIVRDLQMGLERAGAFGGAMPVGYLPDMFGHIAQMPQILRLAGLEHAVVWRGVPSHVDRSAFWWRAPDGSTVRAEYLVMGYGVGGSVPEDAKSLVRRVADYDRDLESFRLGGVLYMNGNDHEAPQPWLGRVVAEANDIQDDYELRVSSLPEFLATAPTEGLPTWAGELRSGARANLLMGVASNRVDVKQAAARAERSLERMAEPLSSLYAPPEAWPTRLLHLAWREMVRNAAHDSICACSVDEVCDAVLHRFAEARQIGDGLAHASLACLATSMADEGPLVANPSPGARSGLVEITLPGSGDVPGTQLLRQRGEVLGDLRLRAAELDPLISQLRSQQLDASTFVNAVEVSEDEDGMQIVLRAGPRLLAGLVMEEIKADIRRRIDGRPDLPVRVLVTQQPTRRVLARAEDVPGFGWRLLIPDATRLPDHVVRSEGSALDNGLVRVEVDPRDGTFSVNGRAGFDRLVDDGDQGDTYNYSPPGNDTVVDRPEATTVELLEGGPLRGRLAVTRRFLWPERIDDSSGARVGQQSVEVRTDIEIRADEALVRVHTRFDNRCRDHRVRSLFPLPEPAVASHAECAFAVVSRGTVAEGGPTERGLSTYPSRRFVHAGGLTVFHEGLLEYQLVGRDGSEAGEGPAEALALTLLRVTSMLSRVEMAYRPLGAGPPIRTEGSQMQGPVEARYALLVEPRETVGDWSRLYALADDALLPLIATRAPGGGDRPSSGSALEVEGAVVSSLRRVAGLQELRVFNPSGEAATFTVEGRSGWTVDLRGRPLASFDGTVTLGPWEIATLRLLEP